jgi:PleD family two-component response regulator
VVVFKNTIINVITVMNKTTTLQANNQIIISTTLNSSIKKRILLVDDDEPDITLTFKIALHSTGLFGVYTFNEPLQALVNFKSGFYI